MRFFSTSIRSSRGLLRWLPAVVLFAAKLGAFTPTEEGIYAVFTTTAGEFTARLYFEDVPLTVANFVGLTEGTKAWAKLENAADGEGDGQLYRERYYDGLSFHRVVPGFVIQTGSRNGFGTDGPGYSIQDEIVPPHFHDAAGVLSMANTGDANSGGSQFFITLAATPLLDGKHSVFGGIIEGMEVVNAIGAEGAAVATMQSVEIVREGAAAATFDVEVLGLPWLSELELGYDPATNSLLYEADVEGVFEIFFTQDLVSWSNGYRRNFPSRGSQAVGLGSVVYEDSAPFLVRALVTRYSALGDLTGKTLTLNLDNIETISVDFSSSSQGTYRQGSTTQSTGYIWEPIGAIVQLQIYLPSGGDPTYSQVYLTSTAEDGGTVFARVHAVDALGASAPYNASGTYSLTTTPTD